jgi:AcrR family transcriptional regulator
MRAEKLDTKIRQEQIAQAAMNLIASHGLKGLSVADLAHRIGLVPSAIYRHFKNKDHILDAVFTLIEGRLMTYISKVCGETEDALKRLNHLLILHVQVIHENQAIPRLIFSDEFSTDYPEKKMRVYEIISRYLNGISEIVKEGQQRSQIRQDIDSKTISVMFLGIFQPAGVLWYLSDGGFDIAGHTKKAWKVFQESIRPK